MENFLIREGKIEDKEDFVNLIIYTGEKLLYTIFDKNVREILKELYIRKNNQFSFEFTNFAIYNNRISGMILSYSFDDLKKVSINTGYLLIKIMKFDFIKNLEKFIKSFLKLNIIKKDEYYISNIAVYPEFRGLGIGKELLLFAEKRAKENNLKKLTLDVEKRNKNAIEIYKNFGFIIDNEFNLNFHENIFSFYKMIKVL